MISRDPKTWYVLEEKFWSVFLKNSLDWKKLIVCKVFTYQLHFKCRHDVVFSRVIKYSMYRVRVFLGQSVML